jgi:sulfopyruvate decarboxylase TPP-binding subunit
MTVAQSTQSQTATPAPVAHSVPADAIVREIQKLGITHVITVPDTFQKTLLAALADLGSPRLLTVCTEDEGIAINAGLYIGGQQPMMVIQNNGLFACLNSLKAIPMDARVPTLLVIGQFARDLTKPSRENALRAVRMVEPTLETWGIPYYRLEGPEDLGCIAEAYRRCQDERGPVAVIVGAPTS